MEKCLDDKIGELKRLASQYPTEEFISFLSGLLLQMETRHKNPYLMDLVSPLRQLFYLGCLRLQSTNKATKERFTLEEWKEMARLLVAIEADYFPLLGLSKEGSKTKEDVDRIRVTAMTFMSYYFNGVLSYQEQEIERIETIFRPFDKMLKSEWGVSVSDFVSFYEQACDLVQNNLDTMLGFLKQGEWEKFVEQCESEGLEYPAAWVDVAPEGLKKFVNYVVNPGSITIIDLDKATFSNLPRDKFEKIVALFSCVPESISTIAYYTGDNVLLDKPFVKLNEGKVIAFNTKQYLNACYRLLFRKCGDVDKDKVLKSRDAYVEKKVEDTFRRLFPKDAFFYSNYSIDGGVSEQDILILYKRIAVVIEVKAGSYRAPMRDAAQAFNKLKSDFKAIIQKGWEQASRVVQAFESKDRLRVSDAKGRLLYELDPLRYSVFSIVVTLESFGYIQIDLENMLEVGKDEEYPWCVNIDDLEAFILTLRKRSNRIQSFITFLTFRRNFHGHVFCADELELCGFFLGHEDDFKAASQSDDIITTAPDLVDPIEESYRNGMGFRKERLWKEKKDESVLFLYSKQ